MSNFIRRRDLLSGAGAALALGALPGCGTTRDTRERAPAPPSPPPFAPLRVSIDRITRITVCTRPFRAAGPRLDVERVGQKSIVHNYGHGGSGWSLSWGSSGIAVDKALATGEREIAVIGCGALGITSALLLQRAGIRTTIYAKELPPNVRSSFASGLWTPDSRICFEEHATPEFKLLWQRMARQSFQTYQTLLGLPGTPVEFIDSYAVFDNPPQPHHTEPDGKPQFADLQRELIPELMPQSQDYAPGSHPLAQRYLRRNTFMMFNLAAYSRLLVADFLGNGGKIEITEFHTPDELAKLREKTLINATGYGARALFGDDSVIPVRGQLARLIPQPEVNYGLYYRHVSFVPRRDGLVVQYVGTSDYYGFDDAGVVPDRAEAENAVNTIASLFAG